MNVLLAHIPKTAGSTLMALLERAYRDTGVAFRYPPCDQATFREALDTLRPDTRCLVSGHEVVPWPLPPDTLLVTVLRDPVERVVSLYHNAIYRNRVENGSSRGRIVAPPPDLATFARTVPEAQDFQARCLAGLPRGAEGVTHRRFHDLLDDTTVGDLRPMPSGREALPDALATLYRADVLAGVTERFDALAFLVWRRIGFDAPVIPAHTVSGQGATAADLDPATRDTILAHNLNDVLLHTAATHQQRAREADDPDLPLGVDLIRRLRAVADVFPYEHDQALFWARLFRGERPAAPEPAPSVPDPVAPPATGPLAALRRRTGG